MTGSFPTTTDQPTRVDSSKWVARIDGHVIVSDDWGHAGEAKANVSDSNDDVPLLGDETLKMERDTLSGAAE